MKLDNEKNEKLVGEGVGFERIRRITGYLVGTVDRFNNGKKAEERDSTKYLDNYVVYLDSIFESQELRKIWNDYSKKYSYAENIEFDQIIETIWDLLTSFAY